jgi:hypothetical protein
MTRSHHASGPCPEPALIAGFLDATLSEVARGEVIAHMSTCARCREAIGAIDRMGRQRVPLVPPVLLQSATRAISGKNAWRWPAAVVAAAACLLLAVSVSRTPRSLPGAAGAVAPDPPVDDVRTTAAAAVPVLQVPASGATIGAAPLPFRWTPVAGAVQYRVQVLDAEGGIVWSATTGGTTLEFSGGVAGAGPYYAWVAAQLADGRRVQSAVVRLVGQTR